MSAHRYRWGGVAWLATLQFFVVEAIAAQRFDSYSYSANVISDLGTTASPGHALMNASFIAQGLLIAVGALLLTPLLSGLGSRVARVLLVLAGVGVLVVGLFPSDGNATVHEIAAGVHLLGGGLGLIALAYAVRPRSEALGSALALLGLIGVIGTIFFASAVFLALGEGGMERVAAYALPVGLAVAAASLWRQGGQWALPAADVGTPSRQQLREQERTERARVAAERDAALEAATARRNKQRGASASSPPVAAADDLGPEDLDDDFDPDDPWARRRRT